MCIARVFFIYTHIWQYLYMYINAIVSVVQSTHCRKLFAVTANKAFYMFFLLNG